MLEGVRAGAGASWPTCSTLPPPAPRLRAPEGQSHLIRPNLQAGASREVKSFSSFKDWAGGTRPRPRGTLPPPKPTTKPRVQCTCIA